MYHFIVNPRSSSDAGLKKWNILSQILKRENIKYRVHFTKREGHAAAIARSICKFQKPFILIAVGGDGTANEVINGITDFSLVTFGYIPTGSSNDLARALGLPSDPAAALRLILHPDKILSMDVGCIQTTNESRRFLVSSGIGFDAAICHEALHSTMKRALNKVHLGKLTYLGIALKQLFLLKPAPLEITLDDGQVIRYPQTFFAAFMNTRFEGGGFMFCPDALPYDGFLDVCVIERLPKPKVLTLLPTAFSGNHIKASQVHILRSRKLHIKTPRPLAVHADGESFSFQNDMWVSLLNEKLAFITTN